MTPNIACVIASLHVVLISYSYCAVVIVEGRLTGDSKLSSDQHQCPVWTVYNSTSQQCECSESLGGIVECHMYNQSSVSVGLRPCYCLSQYTNESAVVSNCPFSCFTGYRVSRDIIIVSDSTGDDPICSQYKRKGPMCGLCEHNHTPPVYSYNFTCVECTEYRMNWLKYIAVAYLPLSVLYFVVLLLRISATTGSMNGLVAIFQLCTSSGINRLHYVLDRRHKLIVATNMMIGIFSTLNLDFFKSFYHPFCLHPSMTTIQVFSLEYLVGVYPLLLVAITYFLVKLHDRYSIVVYLWSPCYRVFSCFSSKLNVKTSLVQAFATFILLSYVKICNVSFDILTPAKKYLRPDGSEVDKQYWYYNGSLEFFGKDHIPYAALAIVMSLLFNILPLLLLILYLFHCFRKFLSCLKLDSTTLHIFMDSFFGSYRTASRYYRLFALFYIFLRIICLFLFAVFGGFLYRFYAGYVFMLALVLVAMIRPYRNKWQNVFDILLLLCSSSFYQFKNLFFESSFIFPSESQLHSLALLFANVSLLFPIMYMLCRIMSFFIPSCCIVKIKKKVNSCHHKDLEEPLPHRLQQSNECSPLIK